MNIVKKAEAISEACKIIKDRAELEIDSVYMKGYHEGRHNYRDKIKKYLIINPELKHEVMEMSQDPCLSCNEINSWINYKKQCLNCQECDKKQNQLLALDLLKHFKL